MIDAEDAFEVAEATIDSHVVKMKSLNADVFVDIAHGEVNSGIDR